MRKPGARRQETLRWLDRRARAVESLAGALRDRGIELLVEETVGGPVTGGWAYALRIGHAMRIEAHETESGWVLTLLETDRVGVPIGWCSAPGLCLDLEATTKAVLDHLDPPTDPSAATTGH